ncbi:MAG: putative metal-binding motif-containing protein [Deltaproteobacteria bacterium]|nr:putative metal-binding motif-containing protein [Deltaproteobacteria bacterium]
MIRRTTTCAALFLLAGAVCSPPPPEEPDPCADPDLDGDGSDSQACGGTDCDDNEPERTPGRPELCDGADLDEDCDPATFGERDLDLDGHWDARCVNVAADGSVAAGEDCDDARADVHPSQAEVCDGRDNDCDGGIDEGVQFFFYRDADGDAHGDPLVDTIEGCALVPGYSFVGDDCDDARDDVHPGAAELCDARDNNCDGDTDEDALLTFYVDEDDDGFGGAATVEGCQSGPGRATLPGDCDDGNAALVNGSMRCVDAILFQICQDGTWSAPANCPTQQCLAQPNGAGNCR